LTFNTALNNNETVINTTGLTYKITVANQGPLEVWIEDDDILPQVFTVYLTKKGPITYRVTPKPNADGFTDTFTFEFSSDPLTLASLAGTKPTALASVLIDNTLTGEGRGVLPITSKTSLTRKSATTYELGVHKDDLNDMRKGKVRLYIKSDLEGIEWVAPTTFDVAVHGKIVEVERPGATSFTVTPKNAIVGPAGTAITEKLEIEFGRTIVPNGTFDTSKFKIYDGRNANTATLNTSIDFTVTQETANKKYTLNFNNRVLTSDNAPIFVAYEDASQFDISTAKVASTLRFKPVAILDYTVISAVYDATKPANKQQQLVVDVKFNAEMLVSDGKTPFGNSIRLAKTDFRVTDDTATSVEVETSTLLELDTYRLVIYLTSDPTKDARFKLGVKVKDDSGANNNAVYYFDGSKDTTIRTGIFNPGTITDGTAPLSASITGKIGSGTAGTGPLSYMVTSTDTITLAAEITGFTSPTYAWKVVSGGTPDPGTDTWTISGVSPGNSSAPVVIPNSSSSLATAGPTYKVYCVISEGGQTRQSNIIEITVVPYVAPPASVSITGKIGTATAGPGPLTFNASTATAVDNIVLEATPVSLTPALVYTWKQGTSATPGTPDTWAIGGVTPGNSATVTIPYNNGTLTGATGPLYIYVSVTDANSVTRVSNVITINVDQGPAFTTQPVASVATYNISAQVSGTKDQFFTNAPVAELGGSEDGINYRWYYSIANNTSNLVAVPGNKDGAALVLTYEELVSLEATVNAVRGASTGTDASNANRPNWTTNYYFFVKAYLGVDPDDAAQFAYSNSITLALSITEAAAVTFTTDASALTLSPAKYELDTHTNGVASTGPVVVADAATNGTLSYQWYWSASSNKSSPTALGGTGDSLALSHANILSLNTPPGNADVSYYFFVRVTNAKDGFVNKVTESAAKVLEVEPLIPEPSIGITPTGAYLNAVNGKLTYGLGSGVNISLGPAVANYTALGVELYKWFRATGPNEGDKTTDPATAIAAAVTVSGDDLSIAKEAGFLVVTNSPRYIYCVYTDDGVGIAETGVITISVASVTITQPIDGVGTLTGTNFAYTKGDNTLEEPMKFEGAAVNHTGGTITYEWFLMDGAEPDTGGDTSLGTGEVLSLAFDAFDTYGGADTYKIYCVATANSIDAFSSIITCVIED